MPSEYDEGAWHLDGDVGHEFWNDVKRRTKVYWPHNTDAFIELYLDPAFGDPVRLKRTAGVQNPDGDFVTFEGENTEKWFDTSGIGYASFDWPYKYANPSRSSSTIDRVRFWGHVYSTAGTRFWFEAEEDTEGGSIFMDRMRIPVNDDLVDEVEEWAAEEGCEHLHTKGAVFERRFAQNQGMAQPYHSDVHVRCEDIPDGERVLELLSDGLDFVERAARAEGA